MYVRASDRQSLAYKYLTRNGRTNRTAASGRPVVWFLQASAPRKLRLKLAHLAVFEPRAVAP